MCIFPIALFLPSNKHRHLDQAVGLFDSCVLVLRIGPSGHMSLTGCERLLVTCGIHVNRNSLFDLSSI